MSSMRLPYFDNLKFLLITLVVIGHAIDISVVSDHGMAKAAFVFIYSFHMPLFIFVSGLFVNRSKLTWPRTLQRVCFFIILGFAAKILLIIVPALYGEPIAFSLLSDTMLPWFMFAMGAFTTLAFILRKADARIVLGVSVVLSLLVGYDPNVGSFLYLSRIFVFFPFFWLGVMLQADKVDAFTRRRFFRVVGVVLLAAFAIACIVWTNDLYSYRGLFTGHKGYAALSKAIENCSCLNRLIAYAISGLMCAGAMAVVPHGEIPLITREGQRSLQIYLLHFPVLQMLLYTGVIGYLAHLPGLGWCSIFFIAVVISFALSIKWLEVPIIWLNAALKKAFCNTGSS